ncbi:exodeoxyribonuclease VII large subunit [soil metagenome]
MWSVGGLVLAVADALAARFGACVVRGEISGFSRAASGHCYFNLKDADGGVGMLRCAMFRRAASLLNFAPGDGQLVEVRGRLGVYEQRGELQFVVEAMQRAGAGALYEQFLRLKARLEAEGLFEAARKRSLPTYPRTVGVVTSLGAAALHDVLTAFARRAPHVAINVYPSLVQGPEAPAALCSAIAAAEAHGGIDTLIVCRGGGSLEDLWAFTDERVVRAIAHCSVPVVCGVGHETDVSLSDFAADLRAPTPTAAAELAAPSTQSCNDALAARFALLQRRVHHAVDAHAQRLDRSALRLARPADSVRRHGQQLATLAHRLAAAARHASAARANDLGQRDFRLRRGVTVALAANAQRVGSLDARLRALDPKQVLTRGYAWLTDGDGRAVVSVARLSVGARLGAVLADGKASMVVEAVHASDVASDMAAGSAGETAPV